MIMMIGDNSISRFTRLLTLLALFCTVYGIDDDEQAETNGMQPLRGTKCSPNQVVTKLTVYEDGAIEAECNRLPCGVTGSNCILNQTACRAEADTFSGMRWAINGQSVLLRCCSLSVPRKIYVGTDLVSLGSYYAGGPVEAKDLYGKDGPEFDFVANIRTEQGGVRVWVYRVICIKQAGLNAARHQLQQIDSRAQQQIDEKRRQYLAKQSPTSNAFIAPSNVQPGPGNAPLRSAPKNPLQYRPPNYQRDLPIDDAEILGPSERLI